jgi:hypothetical protein
MLENIIIIVSVFALGGLVGGLLGWIQRGSW